jgi:Flagellar hook-length control protein FliK
LQSIRDSEKRMLESDHLRGEAPMPIVVTPNVLPGAAQGAATADIVLQAGSVVSARVLQILAPDQVRIAIGGQGIDVLTKVPLQAGQTLQLQVSETADGIGLAIVSQQPAGATGALAGASVATDAVTADAAANLTALAPAATASISPLTPEEALAVSIAAQTAATQQTSLAPLFANLGFAAGLPGLPAQLQQPVAQVLAQRIGLDQNLSADDIKRAFQTSGLFLEANLASGSVQGSTAAPDLKAALIVLRQVLASSLADVTAASTTAAPASSASTPQGAVAVVVQEASTSPEQAAQPPGTTLPGTTAAALAQQSAAPAAALSSQNEQPADQVPAQPVIFIADSEAPGIASPSGTPQIASAESRLSATARGASAVIPQEIFELSSAVPSLIPTSTLVDATARAATSSAVLTLLQEALQASPLAGANPSRLALENGLLLSLIPAVTPSRTPSIDDGEFARQNLPPPPVNGALPSAQPVAPPTLAPHLPLEATLQHLLTDTDGAIARQTLLQIASLPGQAGQATGRLDPSSSRWNFEIPFATAQGTAIAQFEISREGSAKAVEPSKPVWRARFSLDVEPAGPIHAVISLNGERTSVRMWAERSSTASQLRAKASELSQALTRADLQVGDIVVRDGTPVQPAAAPAGHFLDRAL